MRNDIRSLWTHLLVCVVCCVLFIAAPALIVYNTLNNGLGAGLFAITLLCGLPVASLLCGFISAHRPQILWSMPILPSAVYFLCFPMLTDAYLSYRLAQFSGLLFGYGAFVLGIYITKKKKSQEIAHNR